MAHSTQRPSGPLESAVAREVDEVLEAMRPLLLEFVARGDVPDPAAGRVGSCNGPATLETMLDAPPPLEVRRHLELELPRQGRGLEGLVQTVERVLRLSVNVWNAGFMDKLYASTNAVGLASELILAVLNTNVHVYSVSPALTVVEKMVCKALAALFGFEGPNAGGLSQPGGSAANLTALVVARNTMFPDMKLVGAGAKKLVIFTSSHGHYSLEKAAQICGLGSNAIRSVAVDAAGQMRPDVLADQICQARNEGLEPFFVNATAGTTVFGSFDPLESIGVVAKRNSLWLHVDASWGGGVVFSSKQASKMTGSRLADSVTFCAHKMLNVPIQCSFLLTPDVRNLQKSNTLPASYLFHGTEGADASDAGDDTFWDLGDLSLQCGRRGDSLKMALAWVYTGTSGFELAIENAYQIASLFAGIVDEHPDLELLSPKPLPCLQVCFYSTPSGRRGSPEETSERTRQIVRQLRQGQDAFMIDYASGEGGLFLRLVVRIGTSEATVRRLVERVVQLGGRCVT